MHWFKLLSNTIIIFSLAGFAFSDRGKQETPSADTYQVMMPLVVRDYTPGPGNVKGKVVDASTQEPLNGVTVCYGTQCDLTHDQGDYALNNLPGGGQLLNASIQEYEPSARFVNVIPFQTVTFNFALSKILEAGVLRIVLTWNPQPTWPNPSPPPVSWENDLDANLWLSAPGPATRVYFKSRGDCASFPHACLEADYRLGFGPETIVLTQFEVSDYHFAVHNYNQFQPGVPPISQTGALVQVYDRTGLIYNWNVPAEGSGSLWYVFSMRSTDGITRTLTPINCITNLPEEGSTPQCGTISQ